MQNNSNIVPRPLTEQEKVDRTHEIFDSFANYCTFCPVCGHLDKSNMYIMRAESRVKKLHDTNENCPVCGQCKWELGYPSHTPTGFVKFAK